jgi:hypothetical protein
MNTRLFFLTLRVDNLPERRKRQYETGRRKYRRAPIADRHKKKEFTPSFFPPNEMQHAPRCSMRKCIELKGLFFHHGRGEGRLCPAMPSLGARFRFFYWRAPGAARRSADLYRSRFHCVAAPAAAIFF